jgi:hypothetical protein
MSLMVRWWHSGTIERGRKFYFAAAATYRGESGRETPFSIIRWRPIALLTFIDPVLALCHLICEDDLPQ